MPWRRLLLGCCAALAVPLLALGAAAPADVAAKAGQALATLQSASTPAEKALACKQLAIHGTADAVPALAPLLADAQLASWARIALEAIPGPAADDALRQALDRLHGPLLVGVIHSIGVRRDARAVKPLADKLKDPDASVAAAAAVALGRIGNDAASRALVRALPTASPTVRSAVAEGCILSAERLLAARKTSAAARLYDTVRRADVSPQRQLEATRGAILARGNKGLPLLLETLRAPQRSVFHMGLHTARELPGRAVTDALAAQLDKLPADRQVPLLLAVADRADAGVEPVLVAAAASGPLPVRLAAIEIMAQQARRAGIPVLLDAAVSQPAELAAAARDALVRLADDEVDRQLVARLARATGAARRTFVELAGQRRATAAVPALFQAARDADPELRLAALKALGATVDTSRLPELADLLKRATSESELAAAQDALETACARLPDQAACAGPLLARLPDSSPAAQCALLRVLAVTAGPQALEAVRRSLSSAEPTVRDTAVRVLADWPEAAALPALLDVFRNTADTTHRFLALRGCVRLLADGAQPAAPALDTFRELLTRTDRSDDRKVILSGLSKLHEPAALALVEPLLADAAVRAEAELALLTLAEGLKQRAPAEARAAAARLQDAANSATRERAQRLLKELK